MQGEVNLLEYKFYGGQGLACFVHKYSILKTMLSTD
jgi:hypothetical protein